jgi:hypothetical protein
MQRSTIAVLFVIAFLVTCAPAYAYVDPGTGSMLVQIVTGGVAGALVLARLYARRIKDKLMSKRPDSPASRERQPTAE